jgi:fused signal recognition particle receptor
MFESLKKKLKGFFGKEEKPKKSTKKPKTNKAKQKPSKKKTPSEKKLKKIADNIQEEVPLKFEPGELKYEPDIEAIKEKDSETSPTEKKGFFSRFAEKFTTSKLTAEQFNEFFTGLEIILLENNVALDAVDNIRSSLENQLVNKEIKKDKIEQTITEALKNAISSVLQEPSSLIEDIKKHQGIYTIVFFGINGSGKTTSVAKVAHYLKQHNISCVMAAGDTFRAASIEQLETHGSRLNVPVVKHQYGSDPAAVAFDAKKYAQSHNIKVVLVDTAGRMYTKENLMKEMEKIIRVTKPDLKLFVGESITGNDATEQARTFSETIGIDGIILTKADVDEKGGTALSVSSVTHKPIYFLGMGQTYDDLKPFKKSLILENLGL